jgi:hypothetical protein
VGFRGNKNEGKAVIIMRRVSAICLIVVMSLLVLFSVVAPCFAAGAGTWSASYDSTDNSIDVTATPPAGQYIGTTVVYWNISNPNNMQTAVSDSSANPLTLSITSSEIQQALGTGAPGAGNQYTVQVYFTQNNNTMAGVGGQTTVTWGDQGSGTSQGTAPVGSGTASSGTTTSGDTGGLFGDIIAGVINVPVNIIENLFVSGGFKTLDVLIFQNGYTNQQKMNLPWTGNQPGMVYDWFLGMCAITLPFFIIAVAVSGFKLLYGAVNPAARAEAWESIQRWFLALGIIILAPLIVQSLMWITSLAITGISGAFSVIASNNGMTASTGSWAQVSIAGMNINTGSTLGNAVVSLFLALIFGYINVLYIVRLFALTVMFAFTPIMALLWTINKKTTAAMIWVGELASNAFMPVAHALVLCTLMLLTDITATKSGSWLTIVIMLYAFIPISEVIRNSLQSLLAQRAGINEERTALGAFASVMGMGALMGLGRLGAATIGGATAMGGVKTTPKTPTPTSTGPTPATRQIGFGAQSGWTTGHTGSGTDTGSMGGSPGFVTAYSDPANSGPGGSPGRQISPGGMSPPIGDNIPHGSGPTFQKGTTFRYGGGPTSQGSVTPGSGESPQSMQPAPAGRHEKAVRFGQIAGTIASVGAATVLGMAAAAIPGAERVVAPLASAVGGVTRAAATGLHLAGSHVAGKAGQSLQKSAQGGSRFAQGVVGTGQAISRASQRVTSHSFAQHATTTIHSGIHAESALRGARYRDIKNSGLDGAREK